MEVAVDAVLYLDMHASFNLIILLIIHKNISLLVRIHSNNHQDNDSLDVCDYDANSLKFNLISSDYQTQKEEKISA